MAWYLLINFTLGIPKSRDIAVDIAIGYGLDDRGVGVRALVGSRIFSAASRPALGLTHPPIQWVPGDLSPGVKRPGFEADLSPTSAEVKKCGSIHPLPHSLYGVMLNYLSTGITLPWNTLRREVLSSARDIQGRIG
jgi:hypothetical protein